MSTNNFSVYTQSRPIRIAFIADLNYERLADTLKGMHYIAFAILFVKRLIES